MVFFTGDIHGNVYRIWNFARQQELKEDDIVVLLGDVGLNYYLNATDIKSKEKLAELSATFFCIHGNHEIRPFNIPTYIQKEWHGGMVWYEPQYPNILFAKDGEIYDLNSKKCIVIGGAYSVDKQYRLEHNYGWWEDEQPSDEMKKYIESQLKANCIDIVLSHTCPFKYIPREAFISGINQSSVDDSTERWLDQIEDTTNYEAWFCGHWHKDKRIDKMHFLFDGFESL